MARSLWTGSISFGLVNVPVKAFTAVRDHDVHFHQLDKKSGARIRYRKVSEKTGREVESDDIVMGFEARKGRYVTFDDEELDELRPPSTKMLEITDFVALDDIDPIYYDTTYWLTPDGDAATKAYALLLAAMEDDQRVGVGTVVLRDRQHLAAIRPLDGALAMSTMRFADEVVPRSDIEGLPRHAKPDPKTLRMAKQILDGLSAEWDPKQYHDTYTETLRKRIARKQSGKEIVEAKQPQPAGRVVDLMAALEASVEQAKSRSSSRRPAQRTAHPARRKATRKSA